jgi:PAS domain S-box-containing protein
MPAFAQFVLDHHLSDYVNETIRSSFRMSIPVLQYLKHLSPEELFAQSKEGAVELLQYLAENKGKEFVEISMHRWLTNQLPLIGKSQIQAEDITTINYIRSEALKSLVMLFTTDIKTARAIWHEIDSFVLGNNTTATNTYIEILKTELEEETHFSNNIIQASPAITYIFNLLSNKGSYISGKVEEVLGYKPEEVRAFGDDLINNLGHPDDVALMKAGLQQMVTENSNRTFTAEFRLRDKEGIYRWLRSYLVIFNRDENRAPVEVLGQVYEVSIEKELTRVVENREQQLLEAQGIARLGSFDWTFESNKTDSTPELRNIFETDEPEGYESMLQRVHPDDREHVRTCMNRSMQTGLYECEFRYCINNHEKVLWTRGIVVFEGQKPSRMIGTVQDITDRKRIEESLLDKTIQLEKSNADLAEFASVASHDLKEPLRKIITFSDLLRSHDGAKLSADGAAYLQKITSSVVRMKALIDDILAYSSLSGEEQKEQVSLYQVAQDVLLTLELPIKEKEARVTVSDLPSLFVYPIQIAQLFQNLLSNSLKFANKEEPLQLTITHSFKKPSEVNGYAVQKAGEYLQIDVADNGIGFDSKASEKIFGLFNRLHSKSTYEGTGLGLAICRKVAENHGGVIYAKSSPGEGAVFTILLPVKNKT